MDLNEDQLAAVQAFIGFIISDQKELVISGGAGVGKTTLLRHLMDLKEADQIKALTGNNRRTRWLLTATTNKAAEVLSQSTNRTATTIHSLLGLRVNNDFKTGKTKLIPIPDREIITDALIVVDECSMVDTQLRKFIQSSTVNCKFLYVGDHCQLAPVMEQISPVFADNDPVVLNKVMRSLHTPAITALCAQLRESVETGVFKPIQAVPGVIDYLTPMQAEQEIIDTFVHDPHANARILCYTNDKVVRMNNYLRTKRNLPETFTADEWVVSNTMSYSRDRKSVLRVEEDVEILDTLPEENYSFNWAGSVYHLPVYRVVVSKGEFLVPVNVHEYREVIRELGRAKAWPPLFELKDAIADLRPRDACTVYKAQGSTYRVSFVDLADIGKCTNPAQAARMLYVACSRATDRICFIGDLPARFKGE